MHRIAALFFVLCAGLPLFACSSDDSSDDDDPQAEADGPLDCALIEGPNCYNQMIVGLGCVPPGTERGVLSADRASCTYTDGTTVRFLAPAPSTTDDITWHFALEKNGERCFEYESTEGVARYASGSQTVRLEASAFRGISLTCPDGTLYRNPDAFSVFDCSTVFGSSYRATTDEVSFSFLGLDGAGSDQRDMFDCALAP